MKYFDPARPHYGEAPLHATAPSGHMVSLPSLYIKPEQRDDGSVVWAIEGYMHVSTGSFRGFHAEVTDLAAFAQRYLEDPEQVLRDEFGYTFDAKEFAQRANKRRVATSVASGLAALGLDD